MDDIDKLVDSILKDMGVDPYKPARWLPQYYKSRAMGVEITDGFICSCCGKHSYTKKDVCDGCKSEMPKEVRNE